MLRVVSIIRASFLPWMFLRLGTAMSLSAISSDSHSRRKKEDKFFRRILLVYTASCLLLIGNICERRIENYVLLMPLFSSAWKWKVRFQFGQMKLNFGLFCSRVPASLDRIFRNGVKIPVTYYETTYLKFNWFLCFLLLALKLERQYSTDDKR